MDESVGKKLSKARLTRGLSIDEAAHATRLRPDKIVALENDDYSLFASNVYAKGFLQIYGRFLDVDVADFARTLEGMGSISIEDYQYLNSGAPPRHDEHPSAPIRGERRGPGLGSLVLFLFLVAAVGFGFFLYVNWQRIEPVAHKDGAAATPAEGAPAATLAARSTAANPAPSTPAPHAPALRAAAPSDRDYVAGQAPVVPPPTGSSNEVLVQPIKKTWVVVRKDDPNSTPIFEDYLYPDSPPLKLKGSRFFIEARDPKAIQIRKNGAPMAYQTPTVEVQ